MLERLDLETRTKEFVLIVPPFPTEAATVTFTPKYEIIFSANLGQWMKAAEWDYLWIGTPLSGPYAKLDDEPQTHISFVATAPSFLLDRRPVYYNTETGEAVVVYTIPSQIPQRLKDIWPRKRLTLQAEEYPYSEKIGLTILKPIQTNERTAPEPRMKRAARIDERQRNPRAGDVYKGTEGPRRTFWSRTILEVVKDKTTSDTIVRYRTQDGAERTVSLRAHREWVLDFKPELQEEVQYQPPAQKKGNSRV